MRTEEITDIQKLKDKIAALEKKCSFYKTIIDQVPANIYLSEIEDGVTWCNKTNEDTLGYSLKEIREMGGLNYLYEVVHPEDYNVPDKSINHFVNQPEKQYGGLFRGRNKHTGLYKWFMGWGKVIAPEVEGGKLRVLNVDVDLSPQLDTDRQIRAVLAENLKLQHRLILEKLSKREKEVLIKISLGLSSKEIADDLFLSKHTVETHRKNLLRKLEVSNVASLVLFCKETGLI